MSTRYLTDDLRIDAIKEVIAPAQVLKKHPISDTAARTVATTRQAVHNILTGKDDRLLVVIGPCSIHDPGAALEYASRLKKTRDELVDDLLIVMRVYFEKPRTTVGWKGLINDPRLDGSFEINEGLHLARKLLLDVNNMGIPAGTEFLDLITPQYISDLVSWGAIGARTTESQAHRELASGLSCPVGFKNGTNGSLQIACDAIHAASQPHYFLSLTKAGRSAIFATSGNEDCHIILRGGREPNYDAASVNAAGKSMLAAKLAPRMMIDFSHANSSKQHRRQLDVARNVAAQIATGDTRIIGTMVESNLEEGRQNVETGKDLLFGQSITDACIDWESSVPLIQGLAEAVRKRREIRATA
ncbi:MAG: 3-deoxy-7-phosphoheptulonate synthase AroG [Gammaproteobacteria bacterium]|nr:3-deoxy-7-phosphoheptulonate synthase AroG [Gammaproteobacteria bacterium]